MKAWIAQLNNYLHDFNLPPVVYFNKATAYLTGKAHEWLADKQAEVEVAGKSLTWEYICIQLIQDFAQASGETALHAEWKALRMGDRAEDGKVPTRTVRQYTDRFVELMRALTTHQISTTEITIVDKYEHGIEFGYPRLYAAMKGHNQVVKYQSLLEVRDAAALAESHLAAAKVTAGTHLNYRNGAALRSTVQVNNTYSALDDGEQQFSGSTSGQAPDSRVQPGAASVNNVGATSPSGRKPWKAPNDGRHVLTRGGEGDAFQRKALLSLLWAASFRSSSSEVQPTYPDGCAASFKLVSPPSSHNDAAIINTAALSSEGQTPVHTSHNSVSPPSAVGGGRRRGSEGGSTPEGFAIAQLDMTARDESARAGFLPDRLFCYGITEPQDGDHDDELMVFRGSVNGHQAIVLLDPGATGNFVSKSWADSKGVSLRSLSSAMEVRTVLEGSYRATTQLMSADVRVVGTQEKCNLVVMPLRTYDVILGKPWLRVAKPVFDWELWTCNGRPVNTTAGRSYGHPGRAARRLHSMTVAPQFAAVMDKIKSQYGGVFASTLPKRVFNKDALVHSFVMKEGCRAGAGWGATEKPRRTPPAARDGPRRRGHRYYRRKQQRVVQSAADGSQEGPVRQTYR